VSLLPAFRLLANVVGVMLLALVAAMVVKYGFDEPGLVEVVSPVHGFVYFVYLVVALLLGRKVGWRPGRILAVLLAGTVPFLSFVVERRVTAELTTASPSASS
jgi:integral membrane protein